MALKMMELSTILKLFKSVNNKGKCIADIIRDTGLSHAYMYKEIKGSNFRGLFKTKKIGRKRMVYLTPKGELVKRLVEKLDNVIEI